MSKGAIARHYAQAIFEIGAEQQTVDRWREDIRLIAEYFSNRRLVFVLGEPNIPFERKQQIVRDLLSDKVQKDALGLALLLVERELVEAAPRIRDEYERRYNEYYNQAVAEIITVMPLDDELRERVKADLRQITGKRILLRERVDPSILGGAIARVGDTLLDGSVRRKLMLLKQQIERGSGAFGGPPDGGPPDGGPPNGGETIPPDLGGGPGGVGPGGAPMAPTPSDGGPASGDGPASSGGFRPGGAGPSAATEMAPRVRGEAHLGPREASSRQRSRAQDRRARRGKGRRR